MSYFDQQPSNKNQKSRGSSNKGKPSRGGRSNSSRGLVIGAVIGIGLLVVVVVFLLSSGVIPLPGQSTSVAGLSTDSSIDLNSTQLALQTLQAQQSTALPAPSEQPFTLPTRFTGLPTPNPPTSVGVPTVIQLLPTNTPWFTPVPYVQRGNLSADERALFDRANNNTMNALSYRLDVDANITAAIPEQSIYFNVDGNMLYEGDVNGSLSLFDLLLDLQIATNFNATGEVQTTSSGFIIVDNMLYLQLPMGAGQVAWVGVNFDEMFQGTLEQLTDSNLPGVVPDNLPLNLELLPNAPEFTQLLGYASKYITTNVVERPSGQIHFQSTVDISGFMLSDDFDVFIFTIFAFMGQPFDQAQTARDIDLFQQTQFPDAIREIRLNVDHYVNLSDSRVERIGAVLEIQLQNMDMTGDGQADDVTITLQGALDFSLFGSHFNVTPPPDPVIISNIDALLAPAPVVETP